jgi:hypothetical protein
MLLVTCQKVFVPGTSNIAAFVQQLASALDKDTLVAHFFPCCSSGLENGVQWNPWSYMTASKSA